MSRRLAHHRAGSGELLLLLHGIGHSRRAWRPVLPLLEPRFEVLAVDLPGFGESPPLEGVEHTPSALADGVERELDAQGIERPLVAGNSLGGRLALELARRGRAEAVVALSPSGMWTAREFLYSRVILMLGRGLARRFGAPGALLRPVPLRVLLTWPYLGRPWLADPEELAEQSRGLAGSPIFEETLFSDENMSHPRGLDRIDRPVLIAWGTRDRLLLPRQAGRFAAAIPGAELRLLPGCGHLPMGDDPGLVAETIGGFFERVRRSPGRPAVAPA